MWHRYFYVCRCSYDGGKTFHWSGSKDKINDKIDAASARHAAEKRAMAAVVQLDEARLRAHRRPKCMASYRAVRVAALGPRRVRARPLLRRAARPAGARPARPQAATRACARDLQRAALLGHVHLARVRVRQPRLGGDCRWRL